MEVTAETARMQATYGRMSLADLIQECERLRREAYDAHLLMTMQDGQLERLRNALKPFAEQIHIMQGEYPPDSRMLLYASEGGGTFMGFLNFGAVRKAAESLINDGELIAGS